jgi:hypothetical protein
MQQQQIQAGLPLSTEHREVFSTFVRKFGGPGGRLQRLRRVQVLRRGAAAGRPPGLRALELCHDRAVRPKPIRCLPQTRIYAIADPAAPVECGTAALLQQVLSSAALLQQDHIHVQNVIIMNPATLCYWFIRPLCPLAHGGCRGN